jgi:cytochrome c oxidase assembly protein subunit 15
MSFAPKKIDVLITEWGLPPWFVTAFKGLVIGVFGLIALGGSVRIMKAGLACPDWPLCFGDVIPDYHPQVYFEFIHRVVAGMVAITAVTLQTFLFRSRAPAFMKRIGAFSLFLLIAQIIYGGLTVKLLLKNHVVLTHLMLGTGFFATLLWMFLTLRSRERTTAERVGPNWLLAFCMGIAAAVYGQIFLGGLVASNFASLVCIDFPKCHGEWFPTFSGIIGLHMIHRLGGYTIFVLLLTNWLVIQRHSPSPRLKRLSRLMFLGVCTQVGLGIANVMLLTPPLIAVAHLAVGVSLLTLALMQVHWVLFCRRARTMNASPSFGEVLRHSRPMPTVDALL